VSAEAPVPLMVFRGPVCVPGGVDVKDAEVAPDEEVCLHRVAMVGGDADSEAGVRGEHDVRGFERD
jgi:hypothetical protein